MESIDSSLQGDRQVWCPPADALSTLPVRGRDLPASGDPCDHPLQV